MNYQYSPIYKYILLVILITCFLNYYTSISKSDFLLLGVLFTSLFLLSDYILIENHPDLFEENNRNSHNIKINIKKNNNKQNKIINEIDLLEAFTDDLDDNKLNDNLTTENESLNDILNESMEQEEPNTDTE